MLRKIKINPEARVAHIPKELIDQGFSGDLDGYADALTITLVKPDAPLDMVIRSLEIVLQDIRLRKKIGVGDEVRPENAGAAAPGDKGADKPAKQPGS